MPFKGFNRCGRCGIIYMENELKLEVIYDQEFPLDKKLKVTCPKGHSWISKSRSAFRYIRQKII